MEERYEVIIRGTAPLLQNRFDDEQDDSLKKSGKQYDKQKDAEKALYKKGNKVCQPATHIEGAMVKAATSFMLKGKKTFKDAFRGGVFVEPDMIPHKHQKWEIDLQNVVIQRSRVVRSRPKFNKWELEFQILCIDERVTPAIIKQILVDAGKFHGIGDYRPRFGRFEVIKFTKIANK
jgi:hypothetical protein